MLEVKANKPLFLNDEAIRKAVAEAGTMIESEAKKNLETEPTKAVDTGNLVNSIGVLFDIKTRGLTARVGTNVYYAPYVEYGTYKNLGDFYGYRMRPRPYLRLAAIKVGKLLKNIIIKTLDRYK